MAFVALRQQIFKHFINLRSFSTLQRDPRFAQVSAADVKFFKQVVGESAVITDTHELAVFNRDWMGKYTGHSQVALKPKSTRHVSEILAYCNARRLAVVPQGGNTGLVGGSIPLFDEIILSTAAMDTIMNFDPISGVITCQAGTILQTLDEYLAPRGHTVPIDLGAKGSCHIGGNVATNAGGLRLLRYGSLHGSVLGIEAVQPDGTILDVLSVLRKDNTGYDIKQLLIGSEGTLGVITAVALLCPPRPAAVHVAYLACPSFAAATATLALAKRHLGEILSAFEFLDRASLEVTLEYLPGARDPLPGSKAPFFVVVETSGSVASHDEAKVEMFLEAAMAEGVVDDGTIAQDSSQAAAMWKLREGITEALRHRGAIYKYDVSIPVQKMYSLVEDMRERLEKVFPGGKVPPSSSEVVVENEGVPPPPVDSRLQNTPPPPLLKVVGYGHLGDGNLHLNVSVPEYDETVRREIEPYCYEWVSKVRGSVSAEHGLGSMKAGAIRYSKSEAAVAAMRAVKSVMDPQGIMNPYKVLPPPLPPQ